MQLETEDAVTKVKQTKQSGELYERHRPDALEKTVDAHASGAGFSIGRRSRGHERIYHKEQ